MSDEPEAGPPMVIDMTPTTFHLTLSIITPAKKVEQTWMLGRTFDGRFTEHVYNKLLEQLVEVAKFIHYMDKPALGPVGEVEHTTLN